MSGRRIKSGKHPEKALSAAGVRALTTPGRYTDGNGLYLVVDSSGAKRWILRTVIKGTRHDIGLGGLSLVPLAAAREEAARLRRIARTGGDPLNDRRKERRAVLTFKEAALQVHATHSPSFRNVKHRAQWIDTLTTYAFPVFGDRRLDQIDSSDVLKALNAIWLDKPETARRVRQRIRTVFDWAKAAGLRQGDNPVDGVSRVLPKHRTVQKHHASLPYTHVPAFLNLLHDAQGETPTALALEFLILTATRTSEVLLAKRPEFDLESKTWTIPASRMKAGREHRVPLSPRCIDILERAKAINDVSDLVFPGESGEPLSNMTFGMTLRRLKHADITAHGFRSSFRDWSAERTNFPREVCESALAHTLRDKVEAAYRRTDLFDLRRALMETWAVFATPAPRKADSTSDVAESARS